MPPLTLEQKIGQLLICGFDGYEVNAHIQTMIEQHHIGGIILFKRNIASTNQLKALNQHLQACNAKQSSIPLMLTIDQEGGMVARIEEGITYLPGAMALAQVQDLNAVQEIYAAVGKELRALGIHVNFAPVADINSNPKNPVIGVRAFGETPEEMIPLMLKAIAGLESAQIASVAKHFPGHGDTTVDSHIGLPLISHDQKRLETIELKPFQAAIKANVPMIMTAHVIVPTLDSEPIPCTLSYPVLTGLLREKLGFKGVIVTDCLEMQAIAKHYGVVEGAIRAFEAGADLLLISHTQSYQVQFIESMVARVAAGKITEARIDASVARILALKARYQMHKHVDAPLCEPQAVSLSKKLSLASITVLKDQHQQIPLNLKRKTLVITFHVIAKTEIDALMSEKTLGHFLKQVGLNCEEVFIPVNPSGEESRQVISKAQDYAQIIVMSYNAILNTTQAACINTLINSHPDLIVVAGRLPYDHIILPKVSTVVAAYENRPEAMQSVVKVLLGV